MSIETRIDEDRGLIVATVRGSFTIDEILDAIDRSVRHPKFRPGFGVLSDHTDVGTPLTTPQAREMVDHLKTLADVLAGSRWAVVASKPASYGMLRMVSILAEGVPMDVKVFVTRDAAEAWLASADAT